MCTVGEYKLFESIRVTTLSHLHHSDVSLRAYKAHLLELCRQFHQFSLKSRALDVLSVYSKHQQWKVDNQKLARVHRTRMVGECTFVGIHTFYIWIKLTVISLFIAYTAPVWVYMFSWWIEICTYICILGNNVLPAVGTTPQLLQRCWRVWMCGCEHREEIKMGPQTRAALVHWSRVIRKRLVTAWVRYTLYRRERRRLKSIADEQFRTCALPRWTEVSDIVALALRFTLTFVVVLHHISAA